MRAKQSFVFSGAVHASQTLTATGYVVEKYEKRGKNFEERWKQSIPR